MRRTFDFFLIVGTVLTIKIGGPGFWDYLAMDNANRRLSVSNSTRVVVVDPDAGNGEPALAGGDPKGRPAMEPDSFHLVVVGK
jgi:hypothetical protein